MRIRPARVLAGAALLALAPGCDLLPPIDFQRMIYQDRFTVWQRSPYLPRGQELQPPPEGTMVRATRGGEAAPSTGIAHGAYLAEVPVPLTRDLLRTGRDRFETFCAPCHGLTGDGASLVGESMDLRRPPAIAGRAARRLPPGRVFQVIGEGYGLMRSYAEDLVTPEERWAAVAYLQALQLAHGVALDTLPPEARHEAERHLP